MTAIGAALDMLSAEDARLGAAHGRLMSLCPGRPGSTPLATLGEQLLAGTTIDEALAFADGLARIARAQSLHFPKNLFWDLDYPAARLLAFAGGAGGWSEVSRVRLETAVQKVETLEAAYGASSPIRFRYVHDFVYGFDWARWVKRATPQRRHIGPFDQPFLDYLAERASEIHVLIEARDEQYGPLEAGEHRNPFGFSRTPSDEERLHRDLAERGLIPVEAWRLDAEPRWQPAFSAERHRRAVALGLGGAP